MTDQIRVGTIIRVPGADLCEIVLDIYDEKEPIYHTIDPYGTVMQYSGPESYEIMGYVDICSELKSIKDKLIKATRPDKK